jgi:hypothetical protein
MLKTVPQDVLLSLPLVKSFLMDDSDDEDEDKKMEEELQYGGARPDPELNRLLESDESGNEDNSETDASDR